MGFWGLGLALLILAAQGGIAFVDQLHRTGQIDQPRLYVILATIGVVTIALAIFAILKPLARHAQQAHKNSREILDSSADAVFIVGAGSRIEFANQSASRILGYSQKELIGMPTSHLIEDAAPGTKSVRTDQTEVVGLTWDARFARKDGVSVPMSLAVTETGHGRSKRRVWVLKDLTDVRRMQIELERSEDRFKALAECSPVAVFQIDTYGGLLYCNNKMLGLFGLRREDLIGGGWAEWINPEEREDFLNQLRQATVQGTGFSRELRIIQADRNLSWTRCSFSPLQRSDGSLIGFVGSLEDITEIKTTRESLANSREGIADALDCFRIGFAIWDRDDRLVICNSTYRNHYPEVSHALVPGMPYREVLRTYLDVGGRNPFPSEEAFFAHWTVKLHHTGEPWDAYLQGRKVRTGAARIDSGHTVVLLIDQAEPLPQAEAPPAISMLEQALVALDAGVVLYGPDSRVVFANDKLRNIFPELSRAIRVGASREALVREQFANLQLGRLGIDENQWVSTRLNDTEECGAIDDPNAIVSTAANGYRLVIHPDVPRLRMAA